MKLSVVIPSRNQGRFIGEALSSVVEQYRDGNLEVVVRDCVSEDETVDVIEEYRGLPFVHAVSEPDHGQSDALRKGFAQSTGDVLCWLNSDDFMYNDAVTHVLDTFKMHPEADVVFGEALFVDETGKPVRRFPTATPHLSRLKDRCVLSQPSVFFRREAYLSAGGVNPRRQYCMDYELWIKLAMDDRLFVRTPHVLSATRLHHETKTFNGGLEFIREICEMQGLLLGDVSPVWRIYERSRSPAFGGHRSKLMRFLVAGLMQIAEQPGCMPSLARACAERAAAELISIARPVQIP